MKRFFFVAIAATLLAAGCQKTEIINHVGDKIGFSSELGKLTKAADPAGLATLQSYGFKVWVYRNFSDLYYAGTGATDGMNEIYDEMEALAVNYENGVWNAGKDYYWPGANKQLKFYAASCNQKDFELTKTNVTITNNEAATGTIKVTDFVVKKDANNDLMIADAITQAQADPTNNNTVKPSFHHALTKVQFNFRTEAATKDAHPVYIQKIETSKLVTKGSVTYPIVANTLPWDLSKVADDAVSFADDNDAQITLPKVKDEQGNDTAVEITIDGEPTPAEGETFDRTGLTLDETFKTLDTWLLLPQPITGATVTVTYIIKDRQFTKKFALDATNLTAWAPNQFVKYNVVIAPNLITFEPSVEGWDETNASVNDSGTTVTTPTPETPATPTYNEVKATLGGEEMTLYYEGELAENTVVKVKNNDQYSPAAAGTYTTTDKTLTVDSEGKITAIASL